MRLAALVAGISWGGTALMNLAARVTLATLTALPTQAIRFCNVDSPPACTA